ncbi:flagellar protein FlaG [Crassaminicella thermophila]|uniref:Flagellar protein FlaG n=1 Tax=Crassaminicella thermophila TaxID=2599308 RepID=A0A5C0SBN3_CRATE|nr:flagellar protein FlaG [Crassaminicella thermophila]QEK11327.1 flagellar protein FlaG [Crassaminicella thermophila]
MRIDGINIIGNQYQGANNYGGATQTAEKEVQIKDPNQIRNENFPGEQQLIEAIEKSNEDLKLDNTRLHFSIHEKTKQIIVKIIDNNTEETIREIPSEKILDMVATMMERTGLFVDKKA